MKKVTFIFLLFCNIFAVAQETTSLTKSSKDQIMCFYKSYEDFVAKKPVDGIKLEKMSEFGWNVMINQDGKSEKVKDSKIPYAWFTWGENLMRVYKEEIYFVIDIGKVCFYVRCREVHVDLYEDGSYYFSPSDEIMKDYYSEGINGEIKVLKDNMFEDYLKQYGLKEDFDKEKKPKREMKDSVLGYANKKYNVEIKYMKLLIQKMK